MCVCVRGDCLKVTWQETYIIVCEICFPDNGLSRKFMLLVQGLLKNKSMNICISRRESSGVGLFSAGQLVCGVWWGRRGSVGL